jgi:uncharacterized protein (TIRG00374 family)
VQKRAFLYCNDAPFARSREHWYAPLRLSAIPATQTDRPRSGRARGLVTFALKVLVAAALIGWLVRGGALDFRALGILVARPWLGVADLGLLAFAVVVGTLRWRALLRLAGVRLPLGRALQLQSAAIFFNVVIPGNIGGDVIKALYVARDEPAEKRTTILLVAFVDRLVGVAGLVILASLVVALRGVVVFGNPLLRPLGLSVLVLGAGAILGPAIFIFVMRRAGHHLESWTGGSTRIAKLLNQLVAALRLLSSRLSTLFYAVGLAMAAHGAAMAFFTLLTQAISGVDVPYTSIATMFPLGILTVVLPVSPAGIGVGHVAFERLFAVAGLTGGATIFNVYLIGQMAPCLLGVFPYVGLRRTGTLPTEAEASPAEPPLG